jgi:hypothetical protein
MFVISHVRLPIYPPHFYFENVEYRQHIQGTWLEQDDHQD